jgi:hypothetical protein
MLTRLSIRDIVPIDRRQVAPCTGDYYLITKNVLNKGSRVATRVRGLATARACSGAEITEQARASPERLMRHSGVITHGA